MDELVDTSPEPRPMPAAAGPSPILDDGPDAPIVDHVAPVLLSLSFACFAFVCLLFRFRAGGIDEQEEFKIFAIAWATIPAVTIAVTAVFARCRFFSRYVDRGAFVRAVALIAHASYWGRFLAKIHEAFPGGNVSATTDEFGPPLYSLIKGFVGVNAALLVLAVIVRAFASVETSDPKPLPARAIHLAALGLRSLVDLALPLAIFAFAVPFSKYASLPKAPFGVALLLSIAIFVFARERTEERTLDVHVGRARLRRWALHALIVLFLVLLVFDPIPDVDTESHYYYLGPVAAVLGGKTLLVNVNCQYGVVVIYFIAMVMKLHLVAASYGGLAQMLAVLLVAHYVLLYWLLLGVTRSIAAAAATVLLLVVVVHFGQQDYPTMFPSTGPLRFAFGYMFVAALAVETRYPARKRLALGLQCFALGVASVWSFESFAYVFVAFAGMVVFDAVHAAKRSEFFAVWRKVVPVALAIGVAHAILAIATRTQSHHWPRWRMYFDYILLYSKEGFGTMLIPSWSAWGIVSGVYLLSVLAFGYRRFALARVGHVGPGSWPNGRVIFGLTALGIAQYTYFLGRSHPNNLIHILTPSILVASCWLAWMSKRTAGRGHGLSKIFRFAMVYTGTAAGFLTLFTCLPDFLHKLDHSLLSLATSPREIVPLAVNVRGQDAANLIKTYAKSRRRVALFSSSDAEVDALLTAGKSQIWPLTYPPEDEILPSAKSAILEFVSPLRENDVVYAEIGGSYQDMSRKVNDLIDTPILSHDVSDAERTVFDQIATHFAFRVVERTNSGVMALRLVAKHRG